MSLLKAYLSKSRTQRVLSLKPGDKGFSLIEVVVVVAVLAVLAAIAIPQFSALSDDARVNTTKTILTDMYKECEYNEIRTGTAAHTAATANNPPGVTWDGTNAQGTVCTGIATGTMTITGNTCVIQLDLRDGTQSHTGQTNSASEWPPNAADC